MLARYDISPKRSASLLDTFSCIFQGIIPYGAQMLVAISTCAAPAPPPAPLTSSPCCSIPSCCACPACCSSCLTRNKASHFVCLQREPTFSRRWALGVMLLRYLYDAVLWPLSAEIAMQKRQLPRDIGLSAANAPAHTLPEPADWLPVILPSGAPPSSAGSR